MLICLTEGTLPNDFKEEVVHLTHKKNAKLKNLTTDQLAFSRIFLKYIKDSCMSKCILILIKFLKSISAVSQGLLCATLPPSND